MPLLTRVYYNAVFGGLGGLLGWMLFGVLGDRQAPDERLTAQLFLGGALIGGAIGYFVVSVEAIRDRALARFCRLATYGVVLGAAGGALGMWVGDQVNFALVGRLGAGRPGEAGTAHLLGTLLARGLGWMVLGVAIGLGEGVAARSLGKLSYGTLGGALGGFVGGGLFGLLYLRALHVGQGAGLSGALWGAVGLVILGACIGSLSALVQGVFQPASVKVLRGWQEGREYPLVKGETTLGRDERVDIALFRDMRIEKHHALIRREREGYVLVNRALPEQTRVNEVPVGERCDLADGDRIQLGDVVLRFQGKRG